MKYEIYQILSPSPNNKNYPSSKKINIFANNYCFRCGNPHLTYTKQFICCNNCSELGLLTNQLNYYQLPFKKHKLQLKPIMHKLNLTTLQQQASDFLKQQFFEHKNSLIWAVCGAGKTEIVCDTIYHCLNSGEFVAFIIPRADLLYEIAKRLQEIFNKASVAVINGSESKKQNANIYVITSNQAMRFKNAFKLIIVDEVDAFPYEYESKYEYATKTALRTNGSIIYLTSTPSKLLLSKNLNCFKLNRRWHNYKLPVPSYSFCSLMPIKFGYLPTKLRNCIIENKRPILIFISNIELGHLLQKRWQKFYKFSTAFIYANCQQRNQVIEQFANSQIQVLLTTTILERGFTFDNIDVFILDTSNSLYNLASLIQIAGRVNRKKQYQNGIAHFYHQGLSSTIINAIKQIQEMNQD